MKIDICLTATNIKSIYINQIPNFIKIWSLLNIEPKIILINNEIPDRFKEYAEHIILFNPIKYQLEKLETAYIAQTIRILYPALFQEDKTIIISDIDIMPISKSFFIDNIKTMPENAFINYRRYRKQLNICYNVALAGVWARIFNIKSIDDLINQLSSNYNYLYTSTKNCPGWFSDQEMLTKNVMEYQKLDNKNIVIFFDKLDFKIHRLDKRDRKQMLQAKDEIIKNIGNYTDFHMTSKNQQYITLSNEIKEAIFNYNRMGES